MSHLQGKTAIVTGGSRGIGRAIAMELARQGATVVIGFRSNERAAQDAVAAIQQSGGRAIAIQADVGVFEEAKRLVDVALEQFGQVDILVNNAGVTQDTLLLRPSQHHRQRRGSRLRRDRPDSQYA